MKYCYLGVDPAFRQDGFAVCLIDAAANAAGLPLTAWLVQAAREKLACENGKMGLTMYGELYQIDR